MHQTINLKEFHTEFSPEGAHEFEPVIELEGFNLIVRCLNCSCKEGK